MIQQITIRGEFKRVMNFTVIIKQLVPLNLQLPKSILKTFSECVLHSYRCTEA